MPPHFSRDYGSTLPQLLTISTDDGRRWTVKYERSAAGDNDNKDNFYFTDRWNLITVSTNLQMREFCIFTQVSRSMFDMVIYRSDGCNRDILPSVGAKNPPTSFWGIYMDCFILQMMGYRQTLHVGSSMAINIIHGDVGPSTLTTYQLKFVLKLNDFSTSRKRVDVPKRLAAAIGIETGEGSFRLENEQGRQWTVYLRARRNNATDVRYSIMDGWMGFMLENNFVVGDILLFQCISFKVVKVLKMADDEGMKLLAGAGKG
ncbi:hypothetical protein C2S52_014073 [Perilla frutescens var. hirtella]|nr:hypothetical protein C2S52_014073 [Perilla frutescens var. hirtella]